MKEKKYECYGLHLPTPNSLTKDTINKLHKNIFQLAKSIIKNNAKYSKIEVIIGISCIKKYTDTHNYERTGKKGRPKRIVSGKHIDYHIHILVYSEDGEMMSAFCDELKKHLTLRKYNWDKNGNYSVYNAMKYIYRQSEKVWAFNLSPKLNQLKQDITKDIWGK